LVRIPTCERQRCCQEKQDTNADRPIRSATLHESIPQEGGSAL
jgi:hypothetical protein